MDIPRLVVFNKVDVSPPCPEDLDFCLSQGISRVDVSAKNGAGVDVLRNALISQVPSDMKREPVLVGDLVREGQTVVCVVPIDLAAPKGRLILPQVQVLREILDCDAIGVIVKEREIEEALSNLRRPPALVVTDSQVILKVAGDVADTIPLTTFSTLFARFKGDLDELVRGAETIERLKDHDKILMSEACSHHIQADDIGRVKIPRWITQYTGKDLEFEMYSGHDFPENLEDFRLVINCGACMLNRMEMMRRIRECLRRGVPITNYGVANIQSPGSPRSGDRTLWVLNHCLCASSNEFGHVFSIVFGIEFRILVAARRPPTLGFAINRITQCETVWVPNQSL